MPSKIGEISKVMRLKRGEHWYYFGEMSSDKAKSLTFVPAIERGTQDYLSEVIEDGYQRPGSPSRMRVFSRYLEDNINSVVPPIVISSRDQWQFVPGSQNADIGHLEIYGPAAIIDGQHRLGGYVHLFEAKEIVCGIAFILLEGLSLEAESREFMDINTTQKGVPRQLTAFLENSEWAQIAWQLNEDPDSPFFHRISRTTVARDQLFALHSVAKQMEKLFEKGGISELDIDVKISLASQYFTIISDVWQQQWSDIEYLDDDSSNRKRSFEYKMLELTGLIAWCQLGADILHRCYRSDLSQMDWSAVSKLVAIAGEIDWSKTGKYEGRTGLAGARALAQEMELLLTQSSDQGQE